MLPHGWPGPAGGQHPPCSPRSTGSSQEQPAAALPLRMLRLSSIHGEAHNNRDLPGFHNNPPPKEGGGVIYIYIKKGRAFSLFSFSPPTQHSIKRTKPDILFADLASIKAVSIIRASSPKLVKVTIRRSAVKLSFNGYLMPFGKGRGGSQLNLDKVGVPLHSQNAPHLKESYKILDNIQILIISLNSTFCGRGSTKTKLHY